MSGVSGSAVLGTSAIGFTHDPDHPGVLIGRLPAGHEYARPDPRPRNTRFDQILSAVPASINKCGKHGPQPLHPLGGDLRSCRECYPADYDVQGFTA
jgi:hypothetical protein